MDFLREFGFLRPWYLGAVFLIPLLWFAIRRRIITPLFYWPVAHLALSGRNQMGPFRMLRLWCVAFLGVVLILVMAGFYRGEEEISTVVKKFVIVLIQDRSGSMDNLLTALGKVSAAFTALRPNDIFCGVYFSETAVRTACGESAKIIATVSNDEIKRSFRGSTSMGGGTEVGAGLLMALEAMLEEARVFSQTERQEILALLDQNKTPFIPEGKKNSHTGFIGVLETDADFPDNPMRDPIRTLSVMSYLGIRTYGIFFTPQRPEKIIRSIRETGGDIYLINPALTSDKVLLEKELGAIFQDIDTLNPPEARVIIGTRPRTFSRELGAMAGILVLLVAGSFLTEELIGLWRYRKSTLLSTKIS